MNIDISEYFSMATDTVIKYAPSLIGGILVLFIGFWAVKKISKIANAGLKESSLSPEITSFLISMFDMVLKVAVILFAAGIAGFNTSALVGILAAAGFAIGLALQGGLGNFASGIIILVFKPYKVGDWIDLDGKFGKVEEIQIFNTLLGTPGKKTLIIPNGQITENVVTNFSKKGAIRLELEVTMPYEESFPKIERIIQEVMSKNDSIMREPAPLVGIEKYESHFVVVGVKPFVNPDDYWEVTYELNKEIKKAFSANDVKMAYSEGVELGKIGN